jgi:hypothetical protein
MKQALFVNWKTTLGGLCAFLLSVPSFVTALIAFGHHQPVDWRYVLVSLALTAISAGLASAKDGSTHSTESEMKLSTYKENAAILADLNKSSK